MTPPFAASPGDTSRCSRPTTHIFTTDSPGPIRIADRRTIDAVLEAPLHNYIYMCAREDFSGYHNFAADYPTHQANARRYQKELDRRGIR